MNSNSQILMKVHFSLPYLLLLVFTAPLWAAEWHVGPGGNDGNPGTAAAPFQTVQRGLQEAQPGDTVILAAGTYAERVNWPSGAGNAAQPVTLRSADGAVAVLNSPTNDPTLDIIDVDGATVRGLTFRGAVRVAFGSSTVRIEDSVFENISGIWALQISGANGVTVTECAFRANRWTEIVSLSGNNSDIRIDNSTFADNFASSGVTQSAIQLFGQTPAGSIRIAGNVFQLDDNRSSRSALSPGNDASAILVNQCDGGDPRNPRIRIENNRIEGYRFPGTNDDRSSNPAYLKTPSQGGERGNGVSLIDSRAILVEGNEIRLASKYGVIGFRTTHSTIRGNTIAACGINGIFWAGSSATLDGGAPNLFDGNRISDCGWLVGGGSGISTIHVGPGNQILRNVVTGQTNGTAGTVGGDWFGDGNGILADLDSPRTYIAGNVVHDNQGAGISVNRSSDSAVVHNTIVGNGYGPHFTDNAGLLIAGGAGPSDRITVINNLLYNNRRAQFWVWMTALDHDVRHNLFAAGPLTLPEFRERVIDWYGNFYTVADWSTDPPRPGNGTGALGGTPVFLGDLIQAGGDPLDPIRYLVVNASPGTGDAASSSSLPQPIAESAFDGTNPLGTAIGEVARPGAQANIGAVEAPPGGYGFNSYRWIGFIDSSPNDSWAWAGDLLGVLQWRDGWVESPTLGPVVLGEFGSWTFTERFGWIWEATGTDDLWFWSADRQDWIGVLPDGGMWSTRDRRFL